MRRKLGVIAGTAAGMLLLIVSLAPEGSSGPAVEDAANLGSTKTYPDMEVVLEPVPDDFVAKVSADEAVAVAERMHEDVYETATRVAPVLVLYTNKQVVACDKEVPECDSKTGSPLIERVPAWVVDVEGLCAEIFGGLTTQGSATDDGCGSQTRHVVVDANTGELIEDWGE